MNKEIKGKHIEALLKDEIETYEKEIQENKKAVEKLKVEIEEIKQIERNKLHQIIIKNIDVLLELVPNHNKTNCSDRSLNVEWSGCTRCDLLNIKLNKWIDCDIKLLIEFENSPVHWKYND